MNVVDNTTVDDGSAVALLLDQVLEQCGLFDAPLYAQLAGSKFRFIGVSSQFSGVLSGRLGFLLPGFLDLCELDLTCGLVRSQFRVTGLHLGPHDVHLAGLLRC